MHRIITGVALAGAMAASAVAFAGAQNYGYGAPQGSYQRSCYNIYMNGSTLSAICTAPNGQRITSSLNVNGCSGSDISNQNGYLSCGNGYGYNGYGNNGYGNNRYNNGRHRGWRNRDQNRNRDRDDNNDNDDNGYYNNGRQNSQYNTGYYGYGSLPGGSYQQSCSNATMNGSVLSAQCSAPNGQWIYSSVNLNSCRTPNDVRNINGYLRC
jgi:hypothetical protein